MLLPLHIGTVLIVNVFCFLALTKIQTNYYRTNFFLQFFTFYREAFSSF